MSAGLQFNVVADTTTSAARELVTRLKGRVLNDAMGAAMTDICKAHFQKRNLEPNKLGGPKTGFWDNIRTGTHYTATDSYAEVTIPAPILQKINGGKISQRPGGPALAFPISPLSYGRTAREMRMTGATKFVPINRGNVVGLIVSIESGKAVGHALFLVVREVDQDPDPNAIPTDEQIITAATQAVLENIEPLLN